MVEINSALTNALAEIGRATTPAELERRGVKKLRSVGLAEISLLIERAVNQTLIERTLSVTSPKELAEYVDQATREFTRQAHNLQSLADSRALLQDHRKTVQLELDRLRADLASRRGFAESREPISAAEALGLEPGQLRKLIDARLQALAAAASSAPEDLASRTAEALQALFEQLSGQALGEQRRKYDLELDQLERRIAKLIQSLEQTEKALAHLQHLVSLDPGLESIYKTVQGLDPNEGDNRTKQAVLEKVFLENIELRKLLAGPVQA